MRDKRDKELCYRSGLAALKEVQSLFPELKMELDEKDPNVHIVMNIHKQKGLDFTIYLNLQNIDELHLEVGKLWMCWFPCTEKENVDDFLDTIHGLISGKYRILETLRSGKVVKSRLQKPVNGEWASKSSGLLTFHFPIFGKRSFNIVQNITSA